MKTYFSLYSSETPPFFKKLRLVGLVIAAAGTSLITAPVALPAGLVTLGGYLMVGGKVATAMSQAVITEDAKKDD